MFITFEGIDGSGKSTQARILADALRADGRDVVLTREPGGSPGAEEIRRLVLEGDPDRWSAETEILLFTAARRDHLERLIEPSLKAGKIVISDRFADSTRVYQGSMRDDFDSINDFDAESDVDRVGRRRQEIDRLHTLMIGREPDLTFIIDMDPEIGLARARGRNGSEERFEDFGADLQRRMRQGFLDLAREFPGRCHVVDGNHPPETVAAKIAGIARAALG